MGLFTLVVVASVVATAIVLGARSMNERSLRFHTYFDESVQGLEIGAPVKLRGVPVGTVAGIGLAPDKRHVDVTYVLRVSDLMRLGLVDRPDSEFVPSPDLRAQIGTQGITGVKLIDLDFAGARDREPPALGFEAASQTIPAAPSLFKRLEDSLADAVAGLPVLIDSTVVVMRHIDGLIRQFRERDVGGRVARVLDDAGVAMVELRTVLRHIDKAKVPEAVALALEDMHRALVRVAAILERVDGDSGLVEKAKRATDAVGDLGRGATDSPAELNRALRSVTEAADSLRDLTESIDRDPDMLLKGRTEEAP
jgi:paraquat-inducible protein B